MLADPRRKQARALDVEDDLAARVSREHVLREQHHLSIRVNDLAVLGDDTQAVAVAVERKSDLGVGFAQAANQILQILGMRGIRMMIRERSIDVAKQLDHIAAEAPVKRRRHCARDPVAAVDRDLHRPRQLHVGGNRREIRGHDINVAALANMSRAHDPTCLKPLP